MVVFTNISNKLAARNHISEPLPARLGNQRTFKHLCFLATAKSYPIKIKRA